MNAETNGQGEQEQGRFIDASDFPIEDRRSCVADAMSLVGQSAKAPSQYQANGAMLSQAMSLAVIAACLIDLCQLAQRGDEEWRRELEEASPHA
jgi:hypothetical protein